MKKIYAVFAGYSLISFGTVHASSAIQPLDLSVRGALSIANGKNCFLNDNQDRPALTACEIQPHNNYGIDESTLL